ncbi:MAG: type II toxin-antitoxin system PemK/MazF family toxin [Prevotellaceae bacterium]|jgi:mRNA interferase MazF|nr:type II toxin-antitoxin system PemK/MazF family toxin [Prevotellaceae bacterium]
MKQGEIWLINLDPTIGAEMKKTRPAVIINDNALGKLPLKIIVPITDWKEHYNVASWMIKIKPNHLNGLTKDSSVDCFQIRCVAEKRLIKRLGYVKIDEIIKIKEGISTVIGFLK